MPQLVTSHFFNWLVAREYIPVSPVPPTKVERKVRDRILSLSELRSLWEWADGHAVDGLMGDVNTTVKLWLLTGLRRREVTHALWQEFPKDIIPAGANADEEDVPVWRIPGSRMKGEIEHVVPISRSMAEILNRIPRETAWLFPNRRGDGPTGREWQTFIKSAPVEGLRIHDIRRSTASAWATRLEVSEDVIGMALGHKSRTITGNVYIHSKRLKQRAAIMDAWADLLKGGV